MLESVEEQEEELLRDVVKLKSELVDTLIWGLLLENWSGSELGEVSVDIFRDHLGVVDDLGHDDVLNV